MLQQMFSAVPLGEVAAALRPHEGRVCGDASSEASSDTTDDVELPQCKIRRNYHCTKCNFFTQNPRVYLTHTRDIHFEKIKIYECPRCVYASRHHQKLIRHIKMVHSSNNLVLPAKTEVENNFIEQIEKTEDLMEEVEEIDCIDGEEFNEESMIELDNDRSDDVTSRGKKNFFSCSKCNYVTHIRSRYTKHVKYHSMPMIKCIICDFRTPYKWNLDRHMKNHGGTGGFHCSMCNFTADIKQSLTVHEMNHHTPPVGQTGVNRRRNRVGASDLTLTDDAAYALIAKEEEGSGDSRSSFSAADMLLQSADIEMISCNSGSNDAPSVHNDIVKDETQVESSHPSPNSTDENKTNKRKAPRPMPQLIPLNSSTPTQTKPLEPPLKKMKDMLNNVSENMELMSKSDTTISELPLASGNNLVYKETAPKKKNNSFFDKLKERLLSETGENGTLVCKKCGFESKCLSEHSVHEKTCMPQSSRVITNTLMPTLSSTRCQHCRHRCKSSADLYLHLQSCAKNKSIEGKVNSETENKSAISQDSNVPPHPMENVVFVWNNIGQEGNKFEMPLDITINDDSTLPENNRPYDVEAVDDSESMNLSPTQAIGKRVFKCPYCQFWASTASRFHVHIVGHLNKKPFECSLCRYKSNWRWDITKHIKLKSARDPEHNNAKVLMTDETGRRNYSKYNKFLAMPALNELGENEFRYINQEAASMDVTMDADDSQNDVNENVSMDMQPLDLQTQINDNKFENDPTKVKKTMWKCKKCNYKDSSKEALLEHVREHSKLNDNTQDETKAKKPESVKDPGDLAYRCGHCYQLSNWKHVIQRHCRLKHEGVIKVIAIEKSKIELEANPVTYKDPLDNLEHCVKCPFKATSKAEIEAHLQHHMPAPESIYKCYFCPYFVKSEDELPLHLAVHGIPEPEEYMAKVMEGKLQPLPEHHTTAKRHKCTDCPYETNSKSQYMYHEQFHRLPADTPYKCPECNYSVSKRHLLHQHLRVHGIFGKKDDELDLGSQTNTECNEPIKIEEIPFVWVAAKNEFHKMYKCRYCSYVNTQKCKIPNHEKIHYVWVETDEMIIFKCLECKFFCDNGAKLTIHSKLHGEIYGRVYCEVDPEVPDEDQITKLRKQIEEEKAAIMEGLAKDDPTSKDCEEGKTLYFCQRCPTRFFTDSELQIHNKFHHAALPHKCKSCIFSVPQENLLTAHTFVHTDEYRTKTKMLRMIHDTDPHHREPVLELVHSPTSSEITWIVSSMNKNHTKSEVKTPKQYLCKECPAKFFKTSTLNYHMNLHGGEGEHKCKKCSYAVKNVGHLAKHELLHESERKRPSCDYESGEDIDFKNVPLSGTDLFQRKTEAQKRVLHNKDKLVKPNDHFPPVLHHDPQFGYLMHGNPEFIYPTYLKNGRQKEKRYKCHKCPSAFEKREQYKIHLSLHGSKQRYKCELCDYSVKYYANYVQHMRKHQMNAEAQAERLKGSSDDIEGGGQETAQENNSEHNKVALKSFPRVLPKSDFQRFSVTDQQTLRLLQRRRSLNSTNLESTLESPPAKDKKLHTCTLCPYTNQRQDALHNHYKRHDKNEVLNLSYNKCCYCDLAVVQCHFLRDHLKSHFSYQKQLAAQCFSANKDVSFTIVKIDEENDVNNVDIKVENISDNNNCKDEKVFVQISTGEIAVE